MPDHHSIITLIALLVGGGIGAQWIAARFKLPALLLLVVIGLALGPLLRAVRPEWAFDPDATFGRLLRPVVSLAVAIILFEGGLTLELREARAVGRTLRRLILSGLVIGFALTLLVGVLAGLSVPTASALAAILVVTGPTVILPMLRSARIALRPATLLKWEGIVNDPLGALLALLVLGVLRLADGSADHDSTLAGLLVGLLAAGAVAGGAGALLGTLLARLLDRGLIPEHLKSPVMLASVLVVFALSELLHPEMGLLAVTVMGVVLANVENHSLEDIHRFKEQVTTLLVSVLFLVLSARIDPEALEKLVGPPLFVVGGVVFVVRPLTVALATLGSDLPWQERLLVGWIAPRGVVAAAVAAAFAGDLERLGAPDHDLLVPLVFGVILATVSLHGVSIRPLARRLGLAARDGNGILLVGASAWNVALALALHKAGAYVVLADTRYRRVSRARQEGVEVHHGDVLSEESRFELPMERVSFVLAATDDDSYNSLVCLRFAHELSREAMLQLTPPAGESTAEKKASLGGRTVWGEPATFRDISSRFYRGAGFKVTALTESFGHDALVAQHPGALFLFFVAGGRLQAFDGKATPPAGSKVVFLEAAPAASIISPRAG